MKKKALSLALALALCLGLTVPAFAAESDFTIEDGVLTAYTGAGGDVVIPDGVTSIGEIVFVGLENLTSVTIPDGVTDIGSNTFRLCTNLAGVTIPGSVISIETGAFGDCTGLKDVYYGGSEAQWKAVTVDDENDALKAATVHYSGTDTPAEPQQPATPSAPKTAAPTDDKLEVNGTPADPTVYKIDGSNYFKIRDVAALLNGTGKQFAVGYDGALNSVTATTGQGYDKQPGDLAGAAAGGDQEAAVSNDTIYVDGQKVEAEVYKINGSNYFKLRDLGKALNFYVGWTAERGMYLETDKPYAE